MGAGDDDVLRPHQNQIGHPAHHLADQPFFRRHAQLVQRCKAQLQQALVLRLGHAEDPAAGHLLAQQHTEHGRRLRIIKFFLGQVDSGGIAGAQKQPHIALRRPQVQDDAVPPGHGDLIHPRPRQTAVQLGGQPRNDQGIKRHGSIPPVVSRSRPPPGWGAPPAAFPPRPAAIFPVPFPKRRETAGPAPADR